MINGVVLDPSFDQRVSALLGRINDDPIVACAMPTAEFERVRHSVRQLVLKWLQSLGDLTRIAAASYRHDNGFLKLVLSQQAAVVSEVRLHVWGLVHPDKGERQEIDRGNIHSHSSDFVSLVLSGGLIEETYCEDNALCAPVSAEGIRVAKVLCGSRGMEEQYEMTGIGESVLYRTSTTEITAFHIHGLRSDVLHRVEPFRNETVTMCFQSTRRSTGTLVYSDTSRPWSPVVASPQLQVEDVRVAFQWLLARGIV